MGDQVHHFNLPPKKTCTPSKWCLTKKGKKFNCYALKDNFLFQNVINAAEKRLSLSEQKDFVLEMTNYIHKKNAKYFRIHGSGDFYSKEYVNKWIEIVKNCPETKFKVHTRRQDFQSKLNELNNLENIIVRESTDTSSQEPKMNFSVAALTQVKKKNSYLCPNKCEPCEYYCWENNSNIHFDEH